MRETIDEEGRYTLERKRGVPHADHTLSQKTRGLAKHVKLMIASPSKQGKSAYQLVKGLRDEVGAISKEERRQIVDYSYRNKQKLQDALVPREQRHAFGGMAVLAGQKTRAALEASGEFGIHTAYIVGQPVIDSVKERLTLAYSTENLLLNAFRQSQFGLPQIVQVDCTHRSLLKVPPWQQQSS